MSVRDINLDGPMVSTEFDKLVWVRGSNGVECVKWLSKIQFRTDLKVLLDYVEGDKFPNDMNTKKKPKVSEEKTTGTVKKAATKTSE